MSDKFKMDGHKLLWHLDRVNEWADGKRVAPLHIDMGITTGCNMVCTYCYGVLQGRVGKGTRLDMPLDVIKNCFRDAKDVGVRSIALIGEGENTLNPHLYDALDYAKEINLDVSLATNGILLNEERAKGMLEALSWIRYNISAATPESYFNLHRVAELETVKSNIRKCVEIKKKYNLDTVIGTQMVLMKDNVNDIVPLAKLCAELGVDYLVIKPCSDDPEKSLDSPIHEYLDMTELLKEAESYSRDDYNVVVKWQKVTNLGLKEFKKCYGTRMIIGISGDGSVFPCGHFFNVRREEFKMGNITETPFAEIVESDRYWAVQEKISEDIDVNKDCETNCRQYYVSQFLWELTNKPPHVNFI
ncbi:radical SAM protein [Candidatus Pacearchaeota archaeon]|nr:radical SAM protein [Candidatus Pacearchaeota archaeon]